MPSARSALPSLTSLFASVALLFFYVLQILISLRSQ